MPRGTESGSIRCGNMSPTWSSCIFWWMGLCALLFMCSCAFYVKCCIAFDIKCTGAHELYWLLAHLEHLVPYAPKAVIPQWLYSFPALALCCNLFPISCLIFGCHVKRMAKRLDELNKMQYVESTRISCCTQSHLIPAAPINGWFQTDWDAWQQIRIITAHIFSHVCV